MQQNNAEEIKQINNEDKQEVTNTTECCHKNSNEAVEYEHDVVEVEFRSGRSGFFFNAHKLALTPDIMVIAEVERGVDIAKVVHSSLPPKCIDHKCVNGEIKNIVRIASPEDFSTLAEIEEKEAYASEKFTELLTHQPFEMKLIETVYQLDANKVTFFFSADGRVDFRSFVRELASMFRTRIELHQTSGRDEAKRLGGYGLCGYRYCCTKFLKKFNQVTIKMAKDQNLSNNLSKISGPCGRLLCCLHYEEDFYIEESKNFPELGTEVKYNNTQMFVYKNDYYNKTVKLSDADQNIETVTLEEFRKMNRRKRRY